MGSVRSGRVVNAAFGQKGLLKEVNSDHIWYSLPKQNGKGYLVQTKISHGMMGQTIDANLISKMARQLHLTKDQFLDFIDCNISEEKYREILRLEELKNNPVKEK